MVNSLLINRLLKIKKKLNINTQQNFADYLGVTRSVISNIERGTREPSKEILIKLTSKCNINGHWLLTGEGEMFFKPMSKSKNAKLLSRYEQTDKINNLSKQIDKLKTENKQLKNKIIKLVDKIVKD